MSYPKIFLNEKEDADIRRGFPWVFDNEISTRSKKNLPRNGDACEVFSAAGLFLGTGMYNGASKIAVRVLTNLRAQSLFAPYSPLSFDYLHTERAAEFFCAAVVRARALRNLSFNASDSFRLIFAEADFLPGLIVDRFVDTHGRVFLVVQFLALACEMFKDEILGALKKSEKAFGIFERSDANVREREGLEKNAAWLGETRDSLIVIEENGVQFYVDLANGQKTGYFLDQKRNRKAAATYARDRRVLDLFSHTGSFGLHAARNGARQVLAVDISEEAVELTRKNIALNSAQHVMSAQAADAFELLRDFESRGERFDMIILDPPAFAKNARSLDKAYGGYKEINLRAMKLLADEGILVSCSCSHFFDTERFYAMLHHAAHDAHKRIQIVQKRGASEDHPVLAGNPKSEYLKCAIMRVLS